MGSTQAGWTVAGNLAVTGTSTITGAVTQTGAATFASTVAITGALTQTGAASLASTLAVTGRTTLTGGTRVVTEFGVGADTVIRDMNKASQSYTWFYCDGTNGPTMVRLRLYDIGANAFKNGYLNNGTFIWS